MAVQSSQISTESTPVAIARIRSRLRKATPIFTDGNPSQSPKNITPTVQIHNTPEPQNETIPISTAVELENEKSSVEAAPPTPPADKPDKQFAVPAVPIIRKLPKPQPKIPTVEPVREEPLNDTENITTTSEPPPVIAKSNLKRDRDKPKEKKCARKKFKKGENPEKTKMTMFDWIYFNPATTPMLYQGGEKGGNLPNISENNSADSADVNSTQDKTDKTADDSELIASSEKDDAVEDALPYPRVMIGPDGNIIIDEKSLMIQTSSAANTQLQDSPVIVEDSHTTYASFSKRRGKKSIWSHKETMKFYSALSTVGTDFSLMLDIFPQKTRHELRLKFKREEKIHKSLVEKAISDGQQFDLSIFDDSTDSDDCDEDAAVSKQVKAAKVAARKRYSKKNGKKQNAKNGTQRRKSRKIVDDDTSDSETDVDDNDNNENGQTSVNRSDKDLAHESTISNITSAMRTAVSNGQQGEVMAVSSGALEFDVNDPTSKHSEAFQVVGISEERVEDDEDEEDEDKDDEEEVIESLLKTTRYGRQPKRRTVFTMEVTEPKKNTSRKEEQKKQTLSQ